VFRELYFSKRRVSQVAERVKEIEIEEGLWDTKANRSTITGPADTQLWEDRGDSVGVTKAQEFASVGIPWVRADKRSRQRNAERLYDLLCDHNDGATNPGIVFFDTCRKILTTLPAIPSDKRRLRLPALTGTRTSVTAPGV
jgi:hypothetical protein